MSESADECLYCLYYQEDEETGEPICDMDMGLDEDDVARFSYGKSAHCPLFRPGDEYTIVRKQN
ncbi:MAG: hypothetical protein IJC17_04485 [Clostridia bacterium]|nr:hypothetical protein [Clostridia bacterium]